MEVIHEPKWSAGRHRQEAPSPASGVPPHLTRAPLSRDAEPTEIVSEAVLRVRSKRKPRRSGASCSMGRDPFQWVRQGRESVDVGRQTERS